MKRIEFMFPELSNVFADAYNMEYLTKCSDEIEIIETRLSETPRFMSEDVDMIYFACTTEKGQEMALEKLRPCRDRIAELIDKGTLMLATGNAIEDFGKYIDCGDRKIEGLGIFDFYAERYMDVERHNSQFIAEFDADEVSGSDAADKLVGDAANGDSAEKMTIIGHKSQFSFSYGNFDDCSFLRIVSGVGMNKDCELEGLRKNNFFATYSLGPFLVLNPSFAKYILRKLGVKDELCFEKEAYDMYEYRLNELRERAGIK